jgi:uncharacterized protein
MPQVYVAVSTGYRGPQKRRLDFRASHAEHICRRSAQGLRALDKVHLRSQQGMPYVITFIDAPETTKEKKSLVRPTHIDYVTSNAHRIIVSGGLFPEDDDNFPNGGLIILNVESRKDAVNYIENDPFFLNGIFTTYTIDRFRKFIFDHKRVTG